MQECHAEMKKQLLMNKENDFNIDAVLVKKCPIKHYNSNTLQGYNTTRLLHYKAITLQGYNTTRL